MGIAAPRPGTLVPPALPQDLPAAQREIRDLRRRNQRQQDLIQGYREREAWTRQLLALPQAQLAPTTKAVAWAIEDKHRRYRRDHAPHEPMPVYYGALAERTGITPSTVCRAVAVLEARGMLKRHSHRDPLTQKTHTEVEILPALHDPAEMLPAERPRGQGGKRDHPICRDCPPETPILEQATTTTRWTCTGCGTRLGERTTARERMLGDDPGNPDDPPPTGDAPPATPLQIRNGPATSTAEETTEGGGADAGADVRALVPDDAGTRTTVTVAIEPLQMCNDRHPREGAPQANRTTDREEAGQHAEPLQICNGPQAGEDAALRRLTLIAGDQPRHIALNPTGPRKYDWRKDPQGRDVAVTEALLRAHLAGEATLGTELRWLPSDDRPARTYALCWDADNPRDFARLQTAARRLWRAGAKPVLERSPSRQHAGGGRLWLWFADAVDPAAAGATACHHAPSLAGVRECWPDWRLGPDTRGQAVRLPCGVYHRDGVRAPIPHAPWEPAGLVWRTGAPAHALLTSALTPATWVTATASPPAPADDLPALPAPELDTTPVEADADHPLPAAFADPAWLARYGHGQDRLLFAVTAREAIAWCNARHDVRAVLPQEANGYARATWRGERTPSVGYVGHNGWVDYGAGGVRPGGRRDGGDACEALCRVRGVDRAALLQAEVLPALLGEARATLEACARVGQALPGWVAALTTPAGWAYYRRLAPATPRLLPR